jgi:large subunit ribosomal protein L15
VKLNQIKDNAGARSHSKRLGRGEGSGKGKTCGKGHKGQRARSGIAVFGFEGGQNPIYTRLPKRGFNNKNFKTVYSEVNLSDLQKAVDAKKIDTGKDVDIQVLKDAGLVRTKDERVKLLAKGTLSTPLKLIVTKASEAAVKAVIKLKGSVTQTALEA